MINKDISVLLNKAEELRALFVLGQRVIPFLEEIFMFVGDIQPLLDEINTSIQDNLKKMPNASKQLSKVTEATELATNEIMDIVDGVVYKVDIIKANFYRIIDLDAKRRENPIKLLESLYAAIQQGKDLKPVLPHLATAIASMKKLPGAEFDKIITDTDELIQSIGMDASSIMISLQVQDITAQQIAAVNNLLETIQGKLGNILNHFQDSDLTDLVSTESNFAEKIQVSKLHRNIAFDPDAVDSITMKDTRQQQVDGYMTEHQENLNADINEPASQDDIDALFADSGIEDSAELPEDASEESPLIAEQEMNSSPKIAEPLQPAEPFVSTEPMEDEDPFAQFSQDDIDALFGK